MCACTRCPVPLPLIQISKPTRQLRNSSKLLLQKPFVETSADSDCCFAKAAADLWNILPDKLQQSDSIAVFKNNLKTHLFSLECLD